MTGLVSFDEALKSAFQLAYFLQGDRTTAILLTVSAMNKLTVAAATQNRRLYYIPTGRTTLRAARTKIYLTELHLLQRLIYLESEPFERLKENQVGTLHEDDLVVHFIKHLVRITTRRNSFYVTVGLSRVLHDYSTPETKEIYSVIVQDPERVKDDYYYRSRKKQLMGEIKNRFGERVKIQQGARGEERFQAQENSEALFQLVSESLSHFTPWATKCVLPATFEPRKNLLNSLAFDDKDPDAEHQIEINRLHALLDPACFSRLVTALGYDSPVQRLTIPTFFTSGHTQGPRQDRLSQTELTQEELQAIKDSLSRGAASRKQTSGDELLIKVDGQERARFDPARTTKVELTVSPGADLIEVYSLDAAGEVLLAAYPLTYHDSGMQPAPSSIVLEAGQRVSFTLRSAETASGEANDTVVIVKYSETHPLRAAALWWRRLNRLMTDKSVITGWWGGGVLKPALLLLFALAALFGLLRYWQSNKNVNKQPTIALQASPPPTLSASPSPAPQPTQQAKIPDEQASPTTKPKKKTSATPITADTGTTRTPRAKQAAQSLLSVRNVYVDPLGDDPLSQLLRESLSRGLQATGRFVVVPNRDEAQAVLKGTARRPPATKTQRVSIAVRLVSADGQVVWPVATPVKGRRYVGGVERVVAWIVGDLQSALRELERK